MVNISLDLPFYRAIPLISLTILFIIGINTTSQWKFPFSSVLSIKSDQIDAKKFNIYYKLKKA